jgi:hypothetical protein
MLFYYTVPRVSFYTESLVYHTQQQASGWYMHFYFVLLIKSVGSNPVFGEVYLIQHYMITFISDIR